MDYAALKAYIEGDAEFTQWITDGCDGLIAKAINARVMVGYKETEIGIGLILQTIGVASGNALLDAIKATPDFRYVWPLLEQGRLRLDSPVTLGARSMTGAGAVVTRDVEPDTLALGLPAKPFPKPGAAKECPVWCPHT